MISGLWKVLDNSSYDLLIKGLLMPNYKERWTAATAHKFILSHSDEPTQEEASEKTNDQEAWGNEKENVAILPLASPHKQERVLIK